ncbi:DUF932 domain-containing protein [Streptomyces katrae]|uniref:DUF932 domain-containing protein n=1 Tax=Streptomyces katrae TaxID=68223 RepID=UPI001FE15D2F|nr:DUF932 domain-containing protein [Streptomyces katrae]
MPRARCAAGRPVFLTVKLPQTMTTGRSDKVDLYIAAFNSHDGSSTFRIVGAVTHHPSCFRSAAGV